MVRSANRHSIGQVMKLFGVIALFSILVVTAVPAWTETGNEPPGADESSRATEPLAEMLPSILGVTMLQGGSTLAVIEVSGNLLPLPEVISTDDGAVILHWSGAYLPSAYWERSFQTPLVHGVVLKQEPDGVTMTIRSSRRLVLKKISGKPPSPSFSLKFSAQDAGEVLPPPLPTGPKAPLPGDPLAVTTPVTLQLRDTDLRDVFRMLGGLLNMNIIIDPSVPPLPVTVSLTKVPMNEAFGYLMRMYDISYAMMGKAIVVGKKESLSRTMGMEKTRSFHVAYADPKNIPALLQGISGVTNLVVDERLRTIYVTGSDELLDEVERTLQRIDHPGRQIMLQARIVEVSEGGSDEMRSLINAVYERWYASISGSGGTIGYYSDAPDGVYDPAGGDSREINLPDSITFPDLSNHVLKFFDASMQILVKEDKAKLLASPSVATIDGMKATIKLVEDVKYISGRDESGNPTYGDVEAGPVLEFTPTVGRSDIVTLELSLKTGEVKLSAGPTGIQYPESSTREVQTNVRVRDGEPFVVGGLFNETKSENSWKIPIIGDIPLLGELFKGKTKSLKKSEVVMIVVPYILDVPESRIVGSDVKFN